MQTQSDFLVIGSGIAGLSFALKIAELGQVTLVTKSALDEGATRYAQGGIASVFSTEDSFEKHIADTTDAGSGLCSHDAVKTTVVEGPLRVRELIELGIPFTKGDDGEYDLTREGGHNARRILHADDFTGQAVEEALIKAVRKNSNIRILEHHIAIDLITNRSAIPVPKKTKCQGAHVLDVKKNLILTFSAPVTVLATGGTGKVYLYTSNPDTATGDGVAMAYRAGARIANMEFMQFHPTCLFVNNYPNANKQPIKAHPRAKSFLISEALRGEGGVLVTADGQRFMQKYHEMESLAPRDIVARAIDSEMKKHGLECVYLDMTKLDSGFLKKRFPNIDEHCLQFGIDMTKTPIPVVPAAHYICGGIHTDLDAESTIENLFAIGETACTGLHGANRLASNSLLEGVVFAHRAFKKIQDRLKHDPTLLEMPEPLAPSLWDSGLAVPMEERINIHHTWREIRTLMWNYVGIVRSDKRLERAQSRLALIKREIQDYYWNYLLTSDLIELRNIVTIADLIVTCAIERKESRGLHYNLDHPYRDDRYFLKDTII